MATLNGSLEGGEEYSERSIDEAIERSSGTFSPTSPTPLQNEGMQLMINNLGLLNSSCLLPALH